MEVHICTVNAERTDIIFPIGLYKSTILILNFYLFFPRSFARFFHFASQLVSPFCLRATIIKWKLPTNWCHDTCSSQTVTVRVLSFTGCMQQSALWLMAEASAWLRNWWENQDFSFKATQQTACIHKCHIEFKDNKVALKFYIKCCSTHKLLGELNTPFLGFCFPVIFR